MKANKRLNMHQISQNALNSDSNFSHNQSQSSSIYHVGAYGGDPQVMETEPVRLNFLTQQKTSSRESPMSCRSFRPIDAARNDQSPAEHHLIARPLPCHHSLISNNLLFTICQRSTQSFVESGADSMDSCRLYRQSGRRLPMQFQSLLMIVVYMIAFASPIVMIVLSASRSPFDDVLDQSEQRFLVTEYLFSALHLAVRLAFSAFCFIAAFFRMKTSAKGTWDTLPRWESIETWLVGLLALETMVFWSFYLVRSTSVADGQFNTNKNIDQFEMTLSFVSTMADSLMFLVWVAIVVIKLAESASENDDARYAVLVVRSPEGTSNTLSVREMSIQRLALECLRDEQSTKTRSWTINRKRHIDQQRARLLTATELAYSRFNTVHTLEHQTSNTSAQALNETVIEGVCTAVYDYLQAIGKHSSFNRQEVVEALDWCLTNGMTEDIFVRKYIEQRSVVKETSVDEEESWTLSCCVAANSTILDGTHFILRSRRKSTVLDVSVRRLPSYHLQ